MEINDIRKEINEVNEEMLVLFIKRMQLCENIADFKKKNNLPIFQSGREEEIILSMKNKAPEEYKDFVEKFFQTMMDLSKEMQKKRIEN